MEEYIEFRLPGGSDFLVPSDEIDGVLNEGHEFSSAFVVAKKYGKPCGHDSIHTSRELGDVSQLYREVHAPAESTR